MSDTTAIRIIHQVKCREHRRNGATGPCNCTPSYMPEPWDAVTGKKVRGRVCSTIREARNERNTMRAALSASAKTRSLGGEVAEWKALAGEVAAGIEAGEILTNRGTAYKPSAAVSVVSILRARLVHDDCPLVGKVMHEITPAVIDELVRWLRKSLAPNSVRRHVDAVGVVWRHATDVHGLTLASPIKKAKLPSGEVRRAPVGLTHAKRLITALPAERGMRALWATAAYTGMRRGEILGLRWESVDLSEGRITVEVAWNERTRTEGPPKSAASCRPISIAGDLLPYLVEWQKLSGRTSGLVFSDDGQRHFDFAAATRRAQTIWKRAGLSSAGLHQFRHGYATTLASTGMDIWSIQTALGHAEVTTTARYVHELPASSKLAAERFAAAFAAA